MRILFISNLYPNPSAPTMASYNRQQIQALTAYAEIDVIAPIPWPTRLWNGLKITRYIDGQVTAYHPTYYYTPRVWRLQYGQFFYWSIKSAADYLVKIQKFDAVYSSWLYPDSWASAKIANVLNVPLFVKVHGSDVNLLQFGSPITRKALAVVEQARKVVCVSKALKDRLVFLGASEHKLHVLYNGVDKSVFFPMDKVQIRRQLNVLEDEYLVLFVGNLKREKGLGELIAAFKQVKAKVAHSRLVVIGSGPFKKELEQQIPKLDLRDSVQFLGTKPLNVIAQWMNAASVLCLPSYMEGVPNVVLEAFACGTKVVATEVGGIPELDNDKNKIYLVPPRDIDVLAQTLLTLEEDDTKDFVHDVGSSWQENVKELYTLFREQLS